MKTTLDIADDLLIKEKLVATKRHTTLKALVEHALKREILSDEPTTVTDDNLIEIGSRGLPQYKRLVTTKRVASETIYERMEEEGI
ncbi:hypothetical protein [Cerasicoccus arenae]|uniref:DUF2191 domain-containing protein n=1 Tax=Cerasicoccus arenae TaxID=424488 RepID=A0A8J3DFE0_9BACT|nr:hypothetical protein [Cerasicoccus arenae]MBK1860013.1 hypothetical protein [Cerasicoccus arenae]GHC13820.1 hypothetical protein GCM10007047_33920 [Cerasicoccus arenae]